MNSRPSSRASKARSAPRPPGRPYPGLRPFRPEEADRFCGREEQREAMLMKLEASRFLAVLGASGSGKSSLVIAGLIADVADGNLFGVPQDCLPVVCRPGLDPYRSLAAALAGSCLHGHRDWISTDAAERMLRSGSGGLLKCHEHAAAFLKTVSAANNPAGDAPAPEPPAFLIVVDQFEELFRFAGLHLAELKQRLHEEEIARRTMPLDSPRDEAGEFVSQLLHTVRQSAPVLVVLTMRSDYLGDCEQFPGLPAAISDHQFLVPRLTRTQRTTAIEQPLALYGASAEEGLVNRIINELGECDDLLPVLQHALARAWQMAERRTGGAAPERLFHEDYEAAGGVAGALQRHGEALLALAALEQPALAAPERVARFFRCLLDVDEGSRLVRRPVLLAAAVAESTLSEAEVRCLASHFRSEGNNLLMPPPQEELSGLSVLDVSHESLLRRWPLATEWRNEEYSWRQILLRLQSYVEDGQLPPSWLVQRSTTLYKNSTPTAAWATRYGCDWIKIADSIRRAKVEMRRRRNSVYLGLGIIVLMIASIAYSWLKYRQVGELTKANDAERAQREKAEQLNRDLEKKTSALLEEQLFITERNREQLEKVMDASGQSRELLTRLTGLEAENIALKAAITNAGGQLPAKPDPGPLTTATPAQDELVWPVPAILQGHVLPVEAVMFAKVTPPILFTGALDASLWPWDMAGNGAAEAVNFDVAAMALSPDGHTLATVAGDPFCHVIRLRTKPLTGQAYLIQESDTLESIAQKFEIKVEDVQVAPMGGKTLQSNQQTYRPPVDAGPAREMPPLRAGDTVTLPRRVQAGPAVEFAPWGKSETCSSAAWVDDGRLMCGSNRGSVAMWLWQGGTWSAGPGLSGKHRGVINSIAVSPDGKRALTSSDDKTARLWRNEGRDSTEFTAGAPVRGASFSPDGDWILVPAGEPVIHLHRLNSLRGQTLTIPLPHEAAVVTAKFSPDGKLIASLDARGTVKLWRFSEVRVRTVEKIPLVTLPEGDRSGHAAQDGLRSEAGAAGQSGPGGRAADGSLPGGLAWSPDSSVLAAGDNQGAVRVWHLPPDKPPVLRVRWLAHGRAVNALAISPDGKFIATASADRTAALLPTRLSISGPWRSYRVADTPADDGLALYSPKEADARPDLFDAALPADKTGLAWRLRDSDVCYASAAWDYRLLDRAALKKAKIRVRNLRTGAATDVIPVDFGAGPGKAANVSAAVVKALDLKEDDRIEVELPPGAYSVGRGAMGK